MFEVYLHARMAALAFAVELDALAELGVLYALAELEILGTTLVQTGVAQSVPYYSIVPVNSPSL